MAKKVLGISISTIGAPGNNISESIKGALIHALINI